MRRLIFVYGTESFEKGVFDLKMGFDLTVSIMRPDLTFSKENVDKKQRSLQFCLIKLSIANGNMSALLITAMRN